VGLFHFHSPINFDLASIKRDKMLKSIAVQTTAEVGCKKKKEKKEKS